jgi:serine/threonine-protein kinase
MGEVFLAVLRGPEGFERRAVVKRLRRELARDPEYRRMFVNEARLMAGLTHRNILSVLDFGEADGDFFLALEHVDGADLGRVLAVHGVLSAQLAVSIVNPVLDGLAYIHAQHHPNGERRCIVHRDVSPPNILLGLNGDVKLGDFGIAKTFPGPSWTAPGVIKGNLSFASPEQAMGGSLDERSDLFSVGAVLFRCLTGHGPFAASTEAELLLAVKDCRLSPVGELERAAGSGLAAVIRRALEKDPRDRYASADEMGQALRACVPSMDDFPHRVGEAVSTALVHPAPRRSEGSFTALLQEQIAVGSRGT